MARTPKSPGATGSGGDDAAGMRDRIIDEGMEARELPGGGGIAADAGEYVLGTLDPAERARFEAMMETDPQARALAVFWRERLAPLDAVAAPVDPPVGTWSAIQAAMPEGPVIAANDNAMASLRRSRNTWRALALVAALAIVGGAFVASNPELRGAVERRLGLPSDRPVVAGLERETYLAVVNAEGKLPAMIVRVDAATGRVSLRPLAVARPEGRSLEVWHIPEGSSEQASLGLLDEGATIRDVRAKPGDTFAVSEEPVGGSPTGNATGPILYSGQLVREPD